MEGTTITVPDTLPPDMDVYCGGCGNPIPRGAPPPEPAPPTIDQGLPEAPPVIENALPGGG